MRLKVLKSLDILYAALAIVWSVGLILYVFKLALSAEFFEQVRAHGTFFIDFVKYYVLGKIIWAGQTSGIYSPSVQLDFYNALIEPMHVDSVSYSQYPPHFMVMLTWLPLFSLNIAYLIWNFGGLLLSIVALRVVWLKTNKLSGMVFALVVFSMIASLCGFRTMCLGQTSWLYLSIVCLWCWSLLKKNQIAEGIALALSTIKFQYTPFLLIPALVGFRKKTLLSFVLAECLMLAVAGIVLGWPNIVGYLGVLHGAENNVGVDGVFPGEMVNLRGLLSNILPTTPALYLSAAVMLAVLAVSYLRARNSAKSDAGSNNLIVLSVLSALLFSLHTHLYEWVLLALPAVLMLEPADLPSILILPVGQRLSLLLLRFYPIFGWLVLFLPVPITVRTMILFVYGLVMWLLVWRKSDANETVTFH
ncbi:MAG: DUF2029 domain-containing protein [Candidatus Obscuribacterales bacterium]|nr:DUF2029 domain-containing protein [Candidatus Obscuribacterales bacterium]